MQPDLSWFREARYGLFIHYGLYSLLGRGEWVLNKERIPLDEYAALANEFTADALDFDELIGRAKTDWGMKYAVLTCKHHDGFCLYDSQLTDFTAPKTRCGRDLVGEFVAACRKHGFRIGLYHSLNDWTHSPNAVDALERPAECYQQFIDFVHGQIREIMTNYGKVDVMWYDGWWPFDGAGWQGERLNAMVRQLQPGILVNNRTGLKGDFGTPEGHIKASDEPWEAAMTLNNNWGYHAGDHDWKPAKQVVELLRQCACGQGNLLLNIGPRGDGSIPPESVEILDRVGAWLGCNGEAIWNTIRFRLDLHTREGRADWSHSGNYSASDDAFYWHIKHWPGSPLTIGGVRCEVQSVTELESGTSYSFRQEGERVFVDQVPDCDTTMPVVFRFKTAATPLLYGCGGWREPSVEHCRYDPVESDIAGVG